MKQSSTSLRVAASPEIPSEIDRGVSIGDAAALLGCHSSYVRKLLKRGSLSGYRLGRGVRIWLSSVRSYQHQGRLRVTSQSAPADPQSKPGAQYREAVAALHGLGLRFIP